MKKILPLLCLVTIVLSACNLPLAAQPSAIPLEQQAATVVAQTLTAIANGSPVIENSPLPSPTAGTTEQPLASPTAGTTAATIQPNATPTGGTGTPTTTTLTVDSNTNCREGPGTSYKVVIVLVPGTTYQMIARTQDDKYWVVTELGKSTPCWVPAEMSNAFGNVSLLPMITPAAPTSSIGAVAAPVLKQWFYNCSYKGIPGNVQVIIEWIDRSDNETGFRVYRDGALVVDLPANTSTYTDLFSGGATSYSYRVTAYNSSGEVLMGSTISFSCGG